MPGAQPKAIRHPARRACCARSRCCRLNMSGMNYTCAAREEACGVPEVCLARLPVPGPRPGWAVHRIACRSPGRRWYRGREDPAPKPARMLMRKGSCSRPGRRSPTRCRSSAGDTCGPSWPQYEAYYNGRRPIAAASSTRPGPTTLPPTSPRSGSSADPSSAALSTNTSGPHRSHGQDRWPSSGPHRTVLQRS
jgi:hypothetical protein